MHSDFVHLHCHTEYSLLNGAVKIKDLVRRAVELKFPAIALTDHGNLFGAIHFYTDAMHEGIKPILGMDAYIAPASRFEKQTHGIKEASFHLTLLAASEQGYKNLMKLASIGYLEGFYYRPRIDKEVLKQYSEGLIALSGDMKGEIPYYVLNDDLDESRRAITEFIDIFGPRNFFLEIMDQGLEPQKKIIHELQKFSKDFGLRLVATNDVHYNYRQDAHAHDALLCIGTGSTLDEPHRLRYHGDSYYLKSAAEMRETFRDFPDAIKATIDIAERCNLTLDFKKTHLPHYEPPPGTTQRQYAEGLCFQGLRRKFPEGIAENYLARLRYELEVIQKMGYLSYFLVVWDFIHYAREQGIPVGPGRGSAAGSLAAYALGITSIDPIKNGLIFERFLNPDRVSMPDIDIDFCYERRDEVIDYVKRKYGTENVAQIITFGTMAAKAVIRDVGRVMNLSYQDVDRIAKLIPLELNITIEQAIQKEPKLKEQIESDARISQLIETSKQLEGFVRHASTHAAGVVISDVPLTEYVPLLKADEQISTQYNMKDLEKIGLLKMDFLGLKTLTMIHEALKLIDRRQGAKLDIEALPWDDKKTYEMLQTANAAGVFQLESSGMRDLLKKMKPTCFDHLVALLALYRPGPLGSGMVDDFIRCLHNPKLIKYDHPALEATLKETYGVILYQEQVMKIVSDLAGFTLAQADSLRRAIGKKIPEIMEKEKSGFLEGAAKRNIPQPVAEKVWNLIDYFSGYGFNKSHSTAYALISYQTAYLKAHYPLEFMTALLTSEMGNTDKVVRYIEDSKKMGISALPPSVNESSSEFTCADNHIRFGLTAIKNVGSTAIESILKTRKESGAFKSLSDFTSRVDLRVCNRKVLESLIKCGAFDEFSVFRSQLMAVLDQALDAGAKYQKDLSRGQLSFFGGGNGNAFQAGSTDVPQISEWPENQLLAYERELIGFYITSHPLSKYADILKVYATAFSDNLSEFRDQAEVTIGGVIGSIKEIMTKKGDRMAFMNLQDLSGSCEIIIFPETYLKFQELLKPDALIFLSGKVSSRDEQPKIIAEEIIPITDVKQRFTRGISIHFQTTGMDSEVLKQIRSVLIKNKGETPVYLTFRDPQGKTAVLNTGDDLRVKTTDDLLAELEKIAGENSVKIR
ncbi:MAG: DNA polymerase III subunit alpha [Candidatus Omnitrophica bacterium]|nr:DNA polymerase III subunit alpha [Candidatus Omnitrophota bacterium]